MSVFKKYGGRMIVAIVTIILLITIGITAKDREKISIIENKVGKIITPVQGFFYKIGETVTDRFSSLGDYINTKEKNDQLKKKIKVLEEKNRDMEDVIARKEFLENEIKLKEQSDYSMIEARIISRDPENWFNKFIINKGSNDGIKKDAAVIQAIETQDGIVKEGLAGIVIEVGDNWSKVLPITDSGSSVSYKVIRTQDFGVVNGTVDNMMQGFLFDIEADVRKGDKVISSGMGEVFVPGIFIGEITEVKVKEEELKKEIQVKPAVNFKKINDLFVINKQDSK
ncbi:rod shape-determining protein MreC [Senegalia massiliensis]|uniref:Cell shape-determining protein MreC n=1 Tax=Senegalia massiliensis TaxID=1720316 RepID=A0A845QX54_9CLOT|nr:rod shape-determining protein MreC [Senegalia massiliensis]NBI05732.1 rod shape-determining protein MreC [Senegalia massiliensis]